MSTSRDRDWRSKVLRRLSWLRSIWARTAITLLLLAIVASRLDWSLIGTRPT